MAKLNYGKRFRGAVDSIREKAKVRTGTFSDDAALAFANRQKPTRLTKAEQLALEAADEARALAAGREKYADLLATQKLRSSTANSLTAAQQLAPRRAGIKVIVRRAIPLRLRTK